MKSSANAKIDHRSRSYPGYRDVFDPGNMENAGSKTKRESLFSTSIKNELR